MFVYCERRFHRDFNYLIYNIFGPACPLNAHTAYIQRVVILFLGGFARNSWEGKKGLLGFPRLSECGKLENQ
jgi:hypothetical protein